MTGTYTARESDQQTLTILFIRGSFMVSRLANYFPERFLKFVFIDIAYQAPRGYFNVDAINATSEKMLGYPIFGYWYFFNDADAAELMDRNVHIRLHCFSLSIHFIHYVPHEADMICVTLG